MRTRFEYTCTEMEGGGLRESRASPWLPRSGAGPRRRKTDGWGSGARRSRRDASHRRRNAGAGDPARGTRAGSPASRDLAPLPRFSERSPGVEKRALGIRRGWRAPRRERLSFQAQSLGIVRPRSGIGSAWGV